MTIAIQLEIEITGPVDQHIESICRSILTDHIVRCLPLKVPTERAALRRAIVLLRCLGEGPLRNKTKAELVKHLGTCPPSYRAKEWKRLLRKIERVLFPKQRRARTSEQDRKGEDSG
jgi:hypothetical protein